MQEKFKSDSSMTNDYFTCWTPAMTPGTSVQLEVLFNGKRKTATLNVAATAPTISSITPSDPSPIMKMNLVIKVDAYAGNLETDFANNRLTVWLRDTTAAKRPNK